MSEYVIVEVPTFTTGMTMKAIKQLFNEHDAIAVKIDSLTGRDPEFNGLVAEIVKLQQRHHEEWEAIKARMQPKPVEEVRTDNVLPLELKRHVRVDSRQPGLIYRLVHIRESRGRTLCGIGLGYDGTPESTLDDVTCPDCLRKHKGQSDGR